MLTNASNTGSAMTSIFSYVKRLRIPDRKGPISGLGHRGVSRIGDSFADVFTVPRHLSRRRGLNKRVIWGKECFPSPGAPQRICLFGTVWRGDRRVGGLASGNGIKLRGSKRLVTDEDAPLLRTPNAVTESSLSATYKHNVYLKPTENHDC